MPTSRNFVPKACLGRKHAVNTVCWSRIFCKTNFFMPLRSVPSFGIDSAVHIGMPRNEHFLPRSNGATETIPSLFREIFSEQNSAANPSFNISWFYFSASINCELSRFSMLKTVYLGKFFILCGYFSAEVYVRVVHPLAIKHLQGFQEILPKISNDPLFNNMSLR